MIKLVRANGSDWYAESREEAVAFAQVYSAINRAPAAIARAGDHSTEWEVYCRTNERGELEQVSPFTVSGPTRYARPLLPRASSCTLLMVQQLLAKIEELEKVSAGGKEA